MFKTTKGLIIGLIIGFFVGAYAIQNINLKELVALPWNTTPTEIAQSFEECVSLGYPVMESYPRQCRDASGNQFTENIGNELEKQDLIKLASPRPNDVISSPLNLKGEARGNWFFEASAPVVLTDWDGKIIAEHFITAKGEWMTENFVPFEGTLEFKSPFQKGDPDFMKKGTLIVKKDNPSGLPEHDDALEIPINFAK